MKDTVEQNTFNDRGQVGYNKFVLDEKYYNPMYKYD